MNGRAFELEEIAITGVMNCTQAVWEEAQTEGIDLSFDTFEREYYAEHGCGPPDDVLDCVEFDEPEYLIGDWEQDDDGMWDHMPWINDKGFAAILSWLGGAPIVHVVWSDTKRCVLSMCSPCCPGQADLDSGAGEIYAYALPRDYDWDGE